MSLLTDFQSCELANAEPCDVSTPMLTKRPFKNSSHSKTGINITVILFQQRDNKHYKVWENTKISSFTDAARQLVMIHVQVLY